MITFFVPGIPRPGGSKTPLGRSRVTGKYMVKEAGRHTPGWREAVAWGGRMAMGPLQPLDGPLRVTFSFYLPRPLAHAIRGTLTHASGRWIFQVRAGAPRFPIPAPGKRGGSIPDTTKLVRAAEDALTGVCWVDDGQIVEQLATKDYAGPEQAAGVRITIKPLLP